MHADVHDMPVELEAGGVLTHGVEWGGQLVRHLRLPAGTDFTPLFQGLPGDLCQCEHWGYVLEGSIHVRYDDGTEEVTSAGELYHWPGGHTGWTEEGVVFVEFSPARDLRPVLEHVVAQLTSA